MNIRWTVSLLAMTLAGAGWHDAQAAVSPSEAEQLKTTLTPVGGTRAGNADGTIPAWTGTNMPAVPAGYGPTSQMPDFFKDDAVKFTISAANADQYAAKLAPGVVYMLKHYAGYKINVYPSHRVAVTPAWYNAATFANATSAQLNDVNWITGATRGIPFPIPKTGKEAIWDHNLAYNGGKTLAIVSTWLVSPNGTPLLNAQTLDQRWWPFAVEESVPANFATYYLLARESTVGPPNRVGEQILAWNTVNQDTHPQITWQYLVGQRRLRKAPQVTYDGAYPDCGGIVTIDETSLFNGAPDRYDITIVGKAEQYVPYDNNGMYLTTSQNLLGPNFVNPDLVRWELHRVWILDMKVAAGKRHNLPHRRIYLDEDTWTATTSEDYDTNGQLTTIGQAFNYVDPALPGLLSYENVWYNTRGSGYCLGGAVTTGDRKSERSYNPANYDISFFSPNTIAAESAR